MHVERQREPYRLYEVTDDDQSEGYLWTEGVFPGGAEVEGPVGDKRCGVLARV